MDETSRIPSLEELALIKISISLWSKESLMKYMKKQSNGLIYMDEAVSLLKASINDFELSLALKKSLIDVFERVGYELYVYMGESILNSPDKKYFTSECFSCYTVDDLNLSDLKWNERGEILVSDTLTSYMENHPSASPFLLFKCACEICDEKNVRKVWGELTEGEKNQIRQMTSWSKNFLFLNYWLCVLEDHLNDFLIYYGNNILTFDDRHSLHYNLLKYSIMRCFRSNIKYFYSKLTDLERADFFKRVEIDGKNAVLLHIMQMDAFWYMKFVNKYFEVPIMNHKVNKFIVEKLSKYSFRDLIDYNVQQVGKFGDLQCNIFIYLMSIAPLGVKSLILKNLDFYVLNLIGKGKFVKSFLTEKNKKMLRTNIISDLKNSENLARYSIICMNNHSSLLKEFFDLIAENEEDKLFLRNRLESITEGAQYDNL